MPRLIVNLLLAGYVIPLSATFSLKGAFNVKKCDYILIGELHSRYTLKNI